MQGLFTQEARALQPFGRTHFSSRQSTPKNTYTLFVLGFAMAHKLLKGVRSAKKSSLKKQFKQDKEKPLAWFWGAEIEIGIWLWGR